MNDTEQQPPSDSLRLTFGRGLVIIVPLVITVWVLQILFNTIDGIISPIFDQFLGRHIPGLGFISMIILIMLIGIVSKNLIGKAIFKYFERMIFSLPLARTIYSSAKDLINAFRPGGKGKSFREVVLVEYPRQGLWTIGFLTNEISVNSPTTTQELISIYIPNPPNPTSGMMILAARESIRVLDMSVEEGLKLVLSGGIVTTGTLTVKK